MSESGLVSKIRVWSKIRCMARGGENGIQTSPPPLARALRRRVSCLWGEVHPAASHSYLWRRCGEVGRQHQPQPEQPALKRGAGGAV